LLNDIARRGDKTARRVKLNDQSARVFLTSLGDRIGDQTRRRDSDCTFDLGDKERTALFGRPQRRN
jgi:hypothetical protein